MNFMRFPVLVLGMASIAALTACGDDEPSNSSNNNSNSSSTSASTGGTAGGGNGGEGASGANGGEGGSHGGEGGSHGGEGGVGGEGGGKGGSGGEGGGAPVGEVVVCAGDPPVVTIQTFMFSPANQTIPAGGVVKFTNEDGATHTATSSAGGINPVPDGKWDSGNIAGNTTSVCVRIDVAGTYPYYCKIHPTMQGTITVE